MYLKNLLVFLNIYLCLLVVFLGFGYYKMEESLCKSTLAKLSSQSSENNFCRPNLFRSNFEDIFGLDTARVQDIYQDRLKKDLENKLEAEQKKYLVDQILLSLDISPDIPQEQKEQKILEFQNNLDSKFATLYLKTSKAQKQGLEVNKYVDFWIEKKDYQGLKINNVVTAKEYLEIDKQTENLIQTLDKELKIKVSQQQSQSQISQASSASIALNTALQTQKDQDTIDCNLQKCIALTFDDGPSPENTNHLLSLLQERNVKATFFVTGQNAKEYPEVLQQINLQGHSIGNHSYTHPDFTKQKDETVLSEIKNTSKIIKQVTGREPVLFRPPFGALDNRIKQLVDMPMIMWDVDPRDWSDKNPQTIAERIVVNTKPGSIILLHDIHATSVQAAPLVIDTLISKDYYFVTLDKMFPNLQKQKVYYNQNLIR